MQEKFKSLTLIKNVLPFLWIKEEKIRSLFLISFGLVIISIFLNLSLPLVLKKIVYTISTSSKSMSYQISLLLIAYGIIWTLSQTIQQIRHIIMVRPLEKSIRFFCSKLFNHLHTLPMKFHLDRKTGAVTNALERAQQSFPDIFGGLFLFIIPTIIELFLAAIILCYYYGIIYVFILLLITIIFVLFTIYATGSASYYQELSNEKQSDTNAYIVDSLLNFASVKYFNTKKYEVLKCEHYLREREKSLVKTLSSMELVRIGQSIIIGLGLVFLTYTAGRQILLDIYDVSDFVLINGYVLQFAAPLSFLGFIARDIRKGINGLASIMEIYNTKPIISSSKNSKLVKNLESIEFQNVSFGYDLSRAILKNVSFQLQAGKTIGIVGATGSGKSTITNLLFKFYDANSGKILINNDDIQSLSAESLYNLIGIVPQDITLFNTTIYENILYARPNAKKNQVEEAIELAQLGSVLKRLPQHYNTIVGERGLKLSGGEKQRIAIARVLLKKPSLYIFDEATSSLDLAMEKTIIRNITPLIKNATSIIIAHRLSTIINADEILVFQHGVIKERGCHSSLLKQQGLYASLWNAYKEAGRESYDAA